ncbi:hypothetical protein Cch01nite_37120 [Cellulomonas chitinilytica]|uniref:Uncharacterized protein n=1 Tax=Cellulomonas chitinilytica TaxID=398759 RepID=A0A919U1C9_9CELL|nr:hypothetical protein [Cellulomonas chitinilytica]GIG22988.1 hypothetical protein Cch01nite_37120 [Cellulomonas chitinilytica]
MGTFDRAAPARDGRPRSRPPLATTGGAAGLARLQRLAGNRATTALVVQRYEAWEHRSLGDAGGGAQRTVRLPNGVVLTYGQIVALSGDFYRSPEALLKAPASELQSILTVMDRERAEAAPRSEGGATVYRPTSAQANQNNADYELATTGHDREGSRQDVLGGDADTASGAHGEVAGGEHVESGAPDIQAGFIDLAGSNEAHFSPDNIRKNWRPKHRLALDLARRAWTLRNPAATAPSIAAGTAPSVREGTRTAADAAARPAAAVPGSPGELAGPPSPALDTGSLAGEPERLEGQAYLSSAFADHYLTDAFASGHLVSGNDGRALCETYWASNRAAILNALVSCEKRAMGPLGLTASGLVVPGIAAGLAAAGKMPSLLLKTVHDFYNSAGIQVRNAVGHEWTTYGDASLGGHPETIAVAQAASTASRDAVDDVVRTGGTSRGEAALDLIPDVAHVDKGAYVGIDAFATDPAVWNPVLAHSLSPDPAVNPLYMMIAGNVGPQVGVGAKKLGRWAGKKAGEYVDDVVNAPGDVARWLDRGVRQLYGPPF